MRVIREDAARYDVEPSKLDTATVAATVVVRDDGDTTLWFNPDVVVTAAERRAMDVWARHQVYRGRKFSAWMASDMPSLDHVARPES